jgi:hypothetical protein
MIRSLGTIALACVLSGCSAGVAVRTPAPAYSVFEEGEAYDIPPGQMPSPGECRPWYPGAPPGQQPPPGNCDRLLETAPLGAWVLYRPSEERRVIRIG